MSHIVSKRLYIILCEKCFGDHCDQLYHFIYLFIILDDILESSVLKMIFTIFDVNVNAIIFFVYLFEELASNIPSGAVSTARIRSAGSFLLKSYYVLCS